MRGEEVMAFYKPIYAETEDEVVVLCDYDLRGFKYTDLLVGKVIEQWDENICLYYEEEGELEDFLANPLHWPILSQRFVALLDRMDVSQIQYFPANIRNKVTGRKIIGYHIANVMELIPALDWEKSDYELWDDGSGDIRRLYKLVIVKSKVRPGAHIFRLAEDPFSLIVSEELKVALLNAKITGVDFWEVETS
jgi:hypothetical protein